MWNSALRGGGGLTSIYRKFCVSVDKIFILGGELGAGLYFY